MLLLYQKIANEATDDKMRMIHQDIVEGTILSASDEVVLVEMALGLAPRK